MGSGTDREERHARQSPGPRRGWGTPSPRPWRQRAGGRRRRRDEVALTRPAFPVRGTSRSPAMSPTPPTAGTSPRPSDWAVPIFWSTTRARSARARSRRSPTWSPQTYLRLLDVNVVAPLALVREPSPSCAVGRGRCSTSARRRRGGLRDVGGYGSSKAALDHASRVLAAEELDLRVYAVDPGDMRTAMHQAAFPRGHLRPAAPDGRSAGARPAAHRPTVGPLPSGQSAGPRSLHEQRAGLRVPAAPGQQRVDLPRPGAWRATRCGWPWPAVRDHPRPRA